MATSSSAQSVPKKRKRVVLTLENKLAILDRLKTGATQEKLASEYGIGRSTVGDLKKNEDKIRSFALTMENTAISTKGRKVMRICDDEKLDEAVYMWFVQKRSQDMPFSGPILCEKSRGASFSVACRGICASFSGKQGVALALLPTPWNKVTLTAG